jgi:3-hydroxyisobutyrate dehydrogenase-like beta-hydroxyacid dehydrogenase
MASRLRHSGDTVNTWNRDPPIGPLSARQSSPLSDLFGASEILTLCLSDTLAVPAFVVDFGDLTMQHFTDKTLIVFSCSAPSSTVKLHKC